MRNFNRDNRAGRERSFGKGDSGGNRNRKKYDAICDNCGKECQLPFKPTGERPVYCRECFATMGGGDTNRSLGRDNRGQSLFQKPQENRQPSISTEQFAQLNSKLDRILQLLTTSVDKLPEVVREEKTSEKPEDQTTVLEKKTRAPRKDSKPQSES